MVGNLHEFPALILGPMPVGAVAWAPPAGDGGGYDQSYENYDAGGYGGVSTGTRIWGLSMVDIAYNWNVELDYITGL